MMQQFHLRWWPALVASGVLLLVLVNSMGCNYSMYVSHPPLHYYATCEWGKVRIIEANILNGEEWQVSAFQLTMFDQLLYLIQERKLLRPSRQSTQSNAPVQDVQASRGIISFAWQPLDDQHIALFRTRPHSDLRVARVDGRLSLLSPLSPPRAGNDRVEVSMDDTEKEMPTYGR